MLTQEKWHTVIDVTENQQAYLLHIYATGLLYDQIQVDKKINCPARTSGKYPDWTENMGSIDVYKPLQRLIGRDIHGIYDERVITITPSLAIRDKIGQLLAIIDVLHARESVGYMREAFYEALHRRGVDVILPVVRNEDDLKNIYYIQGWDGKHRLFQSKKYSSMSDSDDASGHEMAALAYYNMEMRRIIDVIKGCSPGLRREFMWVLDNATSPASLMPLLPDNPLQKIVNKHIVD